MRILIVSWAWPPIGRIGALRPMGMAREWVADGHEVHVLTGPGDRGGEYAPDLLSFAERSGAIVHRAAAPSLPRPDCLRSAFAMDPSELVSRPISRAHQILAQWRRFPDPQRSWISPGFSLAAEMDSQHRFDVVWTTSPPESVHFIGLRMAQSGVPWVADFRDPWSDYLLARWDPLSRWLIDKITAHVLATAAAVTANTEGVAQSIQRAAGREVVPVRNGFDPVELSAAPVRQRVLGYFGRVDPLLQHPEHLWPALRALKSRGTPWSVEFFLVPGGGGGAHIAIPDDLRGDVRLLRPLPYSAATVAMQTMSALLVLGCEGRRAEGVVTGKLCDYVGSGRPVLVCAPSGYEARRLVESTGTGVGAWGETEIAEALDRLETFAISEPGRASLSRQAAARQMLNLFTSRLRSRA